EIDMLRQDRVAIVSKVVPDAAMKLVHGDEMGVLVARLVRAAIIYGRCMAFEEVASGAVIVNEASITSIFESCLKFACGPSHVGPIFPWNSALLALLSLSTYVPGLKMATTRNLAPPGDIGNGPTMLIPHCEKGHADIMDVISYFSFLGIGE
ncbi:hypothetical protein Tco_1424866, partial [Tanacetum coccineum]